MKTCFKHLTAAFLLAAPTGPTAAPLDLLTPGGTIIVDDVTFSGFSFLDGVSTAPLSANRFDVSGSSGGSSVTLTYMIDPSINVVAGEAFEFNSSFGATVGGGSTRRINSVTLRMSGFSRIGDSFIEFGSTAPFLSFSNSLAGGDAFDMASLAMLSSFDFDFFAQGESFGAGASATLSEFFVVLGFDSAFVPPVSSVPLPAALPLMLGGIGLLGFAARRRRAV
ncbi:MAG: PEP-CTERM sorting domain-containing protein [Paracoccaceae bacterium]